jgi:hypothetical protein
MTPEMQELESIRYAEWIKVVPLSTGRIGILGPRCEVFKVVDNWSEVLLSLAELKSAFAPTVYEAPPRKENIVNVEVDL